MYTLRGFCVTLYIYKQSQRHKSFRISNPALYASKVGAGTGALNNRQILELFIVQLGYLGLMRLEEFNLLLQRIVDIHINRRQEISGGRAFVKHHVRDISRSRNSTVCKRPMILMGIFKKMYKNKVGLYLSDDLLQPGNQFLV